MQSFGTDRILGAGPLDRLGNLPINITIKIYRMVRELERKMVTKLAVTLQSLRRRVLAKRRVRRLQTEFAMNDMQRMMTDFLRTGNNFNATNVRSMLGLSDQLGVGGQLRQTLANDVVRGSTTGYNSWDVDALIASYEQDRFGRSVW